MKEQYSNLFERLNITPTSSVFLILGIGIVIALIVTKFKGGSFEFDLTGLSSVRKLLLGLIAICIFALFVPIPSVVSPPNPINQDTTIVTPVDTPQHVIQNVTIDHFKMAEIAVKKNEYGRALKEYEKVIEINSDNVIAAKAAAGRIYFEGLGVTKDPKKAKKYLKASAEQRDVTAMTFYASYLLSIEHDTINAVEYYKRAALENNPTAKFHYSHFLRTGEGGVKIDTAKSRQELLMSCSLCFNPACAELGKVLPDECLRKQK